MLIVIEHYYLYLSLSLIKILHTMTLFNINIIEIVKLNFASFYSLRFPRPIITNLFLYAFIYYLIKFYKSEKNEFNYLIILSILMGLSLNSFFYHAVNEFFSSNSFFFLKFELNFINIIIINYKKDNYFNNYRFNFFIYLPLSNKFSS